MSKLFHLILDEIHHDPYHLLTKEASLYIGYHRVTLPMIMFIHHVRIKSCTKFLLKLVEYDCNASIQSFFGSTLLMVAFENYGRNEYCDADGIGL